MMLSFCEILPHTNRHNPQGVKLNQPETRYIPSLPPHSSNLNNAHGVGRPPDDRTAINNTKTLLAYRNPNTIISTFYSWKQHPFYIIFFRGVGGILASASLPF
jgi:hypothetical protein